MSNDTPEVSNKQGSSPADVGAFRKRFGRWFSGIRRQSSRSDERTGAQPSSSDEHGQEFRSYVSHVIRMTGEFLVMAGAAVFIEWLSRVAVVHGVLDGVTFKGLIASKSALEAIVMCLDAIPYCVLKFVSFIILLADVRVLMAHLREYVKASQER